MSTPCTACGDGSLESTRAVLGGTCCPGINYFKLVAGQLNYDYTDGGCETISDANPARAVAGFNLKHIPFSGFPAPYPIPYTSDCLVFLDDSTSFTIYGAGAGTNPSLQAQLSGSFRQPYSAANGEAVGWIPPVTNVQLARYVFTICATATYYIVEADIPYGGPGDDPFTCEGTPLFLRGCTGTASINDAYGVELGLPTLPTNSCNDACRPALSGDISLMARVRMMGSNTSSFTVGTSPTATSLIDFVSRLGAGGSPAFGGNLTGGDATGFIDVGACNPPTEDPFDSGLP